MRTEDQLGSTPMLLAVMSGNALTVRCLGSLGADVMILNAHRIGVIQLCAFRQYTDILEYFIDEHKDRLQVWKILNKFLNSNEEEESRATAKTLRMLTKKTGNESNPYAQAAVDNGVIHALVKVFKSSKGDGPKVQCLHVIQNLLDDPNVKDQFMAEGGMTTFIKLLKSENVKIVTLVCSCFKELCSVQEFAEDAAELGALPALVKVLQNTELGAEILVEPVQIICDIAATSSELQSAVGLTPEIFSTLSGLFENCTHRPLQLVLTKTVSVLTNGNTENQNELVQSGVATRIISLTKVRNKELQFIAVDAMYNLAADNPFTDRKILDEGCASFLITLLKKNKQPHIQERTAQAIWALAGDDPDERRNMANLMGVVQLVDFLTATSEHLHFIGSEALGVLAQGPLNKQTAIGEANGVHSLVRLLKSEREHIVLSVIRTLRHLCLGVAYVAHKKNQTRLSQSRGVKFLVAIMAHSEKATVRVEAAFALACASVGESKYKPSDPLYLMNKFRNLSSQQQHWTVN